MPTAALPRDKRVVALSWDNFLALLREQWLPGQHMALVGPTGQGKTTAAIGIANLRRFVVVLDAKGMDDTLTASGYERLASWPPPPRIRNAIADGHPARLIIGGPARTGEEIAELHRVLTDAVDGVQAEGRWTLMCDEMQVISDRRMHNLLAKIEQLLIAARTRGTTVMSSFQAPAWVPKAAHRQASWSLMWQNQDDEMVKTIAQSAGRNWREMKAMIEELPEFHLLAIPRRLKEPVILTHPPKVG